MKLYAGTLHDVNEQTPPRATVYRGSEWREAEHTGNVDIMSYSLMKTDWTAEAHPSVI